MWAENYKTESFDIDRLHNILEGGVDAYARQEGKTFAIFTQLVGEAQLGGPGNNYLYVGETQAIVRQFMEEFIQVLEDEEIIPLKIRRAEGSVETPTNRFYFMHISDQISCKVKGCCFARMFIDLTASTQNDYHEILHDVSFRTTDYYVL